jgi:hypothetical protein
MSGFGNRYRAFDRLQQGHRLLGFPLAVLQKTPTTRAGTWWPRSPTKTLGGYYVGHTLKHAGNVYGTFGLVIGLLSLDLFVRVPHAARRRGQRR